jgi:hypothetical protein
MTLRPKDLTDQISDELKNPDKRDYMMPIEVVSWLLNEGCRIVTGIAWWILKLFIIEEGKDTPRWVLNRKR